MPVDHDRALEFDHDFAVLIEAGNFEAHNAHIRPRLRQAHFKHATLGIDRIAVEDGAGQADFIPAQVDGVLRDVLTDRPVTIASVSVESTSGFLNSVCAAYTLSKWIGLLLTVSSVNQILSVCVMVRPTGC